jgi:hypothetical protein
LKKKWRKRRVFFALTSIANIKKKIFFSYMRMRHRNENVVFNYTVSSKEWKFNIQNSRLSFLALQPGKCIIISIQKNTWIVPMANVICLPQSNRTFFKNENNNKETSLIRLYPLRRFGKVIADATMFGGIFSDHLVASLELWGWPSVCNNVKPAKNYPSFSHRTSDKITLIFLAALQT